MISCSFHAGRPYEKLLTELRGLCSKMDGSIRHNRLLQQNGFDLGDWQPSQQQSGQSYVGSGHFRFAEDCRPIVPSDRGCHSRWPGWIERMKKAGLIRSMSKKGCSPDNTAFEGFFGRLKNKRLYGRLWTERSPDDSSRKRDGYIHWYYNKRLKLSLDGRSPFEYRRHLGLAASLVHLSVRPLLAAVGEGIPETKYQRSTVHLYIFFFV